MNPATSIRRKVTFALFGVTGLAMAAVATALWVFEYRAADLRARATLESLAETLAPGLLASLDFDTPAVATENLQRLESGGIVIAATVFRTFADDTPPQLFATYLRPGIAPAYSPQPGASGFTRQDDRALLNHILRADGRPIALLQLEADVGPFRRSLHESLAILGLVIALVGAASLWLTRLLQRALTRPLLQLADTVDRVRTGNDYSTRAAIATRDEVGHLAEGFNLMLAGIEQRDRQLAEQSAFQQAVLENAGVSIISTDAAGIVRSFNVAAEHMLGYRREDVVGRITPLAFHPPEELARHAARLTRSLGRPIPPDFAVFAELAHDTPSGLEWTYVRADGTRLPVFLVVSALRSPSGQPLGFCGIATDLSERKAAEAAVRASEERMRQSFEVSPIGLGLSDDNGRILYLNRKFVEWFGYTPLEIPDIDTWYTLAYPDPAQRERIKRLWTERIATARGGEIEPMESEVACRDGQRRLIEFRGQQFGTLMLVALTDITERKATEESIRRSEERFRIVAEQTGQLIFDQDLATGDRVWAGAALAMIGYPLEEMNGTRPSWWTEKVHPQDQDAFRTEFSRLCEHGGTHQFVYRFRHRDGRWIYLTSIVTALGDAAGKPVRLLGNIADVTKQQEDAEAIRRLNTELEQRVHDRTAELAQRVAEVEHLNADQQSLMASLRESQAATDRAAARLQEANANLLAANQELESFSYSVSHDLRSPLRNIAGFIELLRKRTADQLDSEADRYFGIVGTEAIRMGALIDDLLTFSRIGRTEFHLAPVQLVSLVNEVQSELETDLAGRRIDWRIHPLPPVLGDRTLLRQVVVNLVSNAVKFTRKRALATIEIGVQPAGTGAEFLTFFVRDNGAGFDPKYASKLFGVFQRLHNPRDFEGTGIGLANVKRIVERHGGRVWAEGAPENGATFYFTLRPASP